MGGLAVKYFWKKEREGGMRVGELVTLSICLYLGIVLSSG